MLKIIDNVAYQIRIPDMSKTHYSYSLIGTLIYILGVMFCLTGCNKHSLDTHTQFSPPTNPSTVQLSLDEIYTISKSSIKKYTQLTTIGNVVPFRVAIASNQTPGILDFLPKEEGDFVYKGQLIAKVDSTDLQRKANKQIHIIKQKKAELQLQKNELTRYTEALKKDIISRREFEQIQSKYTILDSALEQSKIELNQIQTDIERSKIYSPLTGIISKRPAILGSYLQRGANIYEIVQIDKLYVELSIPNKYIPSVTVGQTINLTIQYQDKDINITATISYIKPIIDKLTRNGSVSLLISNVDNIIKANTFVNCSMELPLATPQMILPQSAINEEKDKYYIYILDKENNNIAYKHYLSINQDRIPEYMDSLEEGTQIVSTPINETYPNTIELEYL